MDAHRDCKKCAGKVALWLSGEDVLRVTGRKDVYHEVEEWICNECRFEKKNKNDWNVEGPRMIERNSVIAQNHYRVKKDLKIDVSNEKLLGEKSHNE